MVKNLPKRKNLRIFQYDYSQNGLYFLTICIKNRLSILSEIKQNNETIELHLLNPGKVVEKCINSINNIYKDIRIDNYVIMPNHIHMVCEISIKENSSKCGSSRTPTPTNAKIPALISTLKRITHKECKNLIWQRNYYEHIIRNENEYLEILTYIDNNPYNWNKDKYFV